MNCTVADCARSHHAKGYCSTHYLRMKQYGRLDVLPRRSFAERFWSKVNQEGEHWLWQGVVASGYGLFGWRENGEHKQRGAHVIAYELANDVTMTPGMAIDHLCRVPLCCRPNHLEVVTPKENTLRGEGPAAKNARKTHCKRGHELAGSNLRIRQGKSGPQRTCRKCDYLHTKAVRERRRQLSA